MSNYTQFELFLIILRVAIVFTQYIVNLNKIMELNNLTQENVLKA